MGHQSNQTLHTAPVVCDSTDSPSRLHRIAANLVLAVRTLPPAIAQGRPRHAPVAHPTVERLARTHRRGGRRHGDLAPFLGGDRALLVGGIVAVRPAVAHKVPADADAGRAALERAGRTAGAIGTAAAGRRAVAVRTVAALLGVAERVRIAELAGAMRAAALANGDRTVAEIDSRADACAVVNGLENNSFALITSIYKSCI